MQFGGNNGITQSNMIGVNFADEWAKRKSIQTEVTIIQTQKPTIKIRTNRINFPQATLNTFAESK